MITKIIKSVKQYNQEAEARYQEAVNNWKPERGGFPFMGFYIYYKPETQERYRRGIVVEWQSTEGGKGSRLFQKRKEAEKFLNTQTV